EIEGLLKGLSSTDIVKAEYVFDDIGIGVTLIKEAQDANVDKEMFLRLTRVAEILCQRTNEGKFIKTSLILMTRQSDNDYYNQYEKDIVLRLGSKFLDSDIKVLIEKALNVNAENTTFVILLTNSKNKSYD